MKSTDWLELAARIFVIVTLIPAVYYGVKRGRSRQALSAKALKALVLLILFWVCAFALLFTALVHWDISNSAAIIIPGFFLIVVAGISLVAVAAKYSEKS